MIDPETCSCSCIELIPIQRFMLVLDRSGGMQGSNLDLARIGANFWFDYINADEEFGLVTFSSFPRLDFSVSPVPVGKITAQTWRDRFRAMADDLKDNGPKDKNAAITDALCLGLEAIKSGGRASSQVIILFAASLQDVEADKIDRVLPELVASGVRCYTIGLRNKQDTLLARIARLTGGQYFTIDEDMTFDEAAIAISEVLIYIAGICRENSGVVSFWEIDGAKIKSEAVDDGEQAVPFLQSMGGGSHGRKKPQPLERFRFPVNITVGSSHCTLGVLWKHTHQRFRIRIYDPDGKDLGRRKRILGHRIRWVEHKNYPFAFCEIERPQPGKWQVEVVGRGVRTVGFRTIGFEVNDRIRFEVWPAASHIRSGKEIEIHARLLVPIAVPGVRMSGWFRTPVGVWKRLRFRQVETNKRSDGRSVYRANFPSAAEGQYLIAVNAYCEGKILLQANLNGCLTEKTKHSSNMCHEISVPRTKRWLLLTVLADSEGCSKEFPCGQNSKLPWIPSNQQDCLADWRSRPRSSATHEFFAKQ